MVFSGNANLRLASSIAHELNVPLGKAVVGRFSDGEVMVEIMENVRGRDVFIVQPTCAPTNNNLMELLVMVDALRRASAARITTVIPYFGYARQDRRPRSARVPITAKVVADMMDAVGADTFEGSLNCLKPLGMMISFGNASGPVPPFSVGLLGQKGSLKITRPTVFTHISDNQAC